MRSPGRQAKHLAWRIRDLPADVRSLFDGSRHRLVPRPSLRRFVGNGPFEVIGDEMVGHLVEVGELGPSDDVLDVGCGIGRVARPLTGVLDGGTYTGFDVVPHGIRWCRRHITRRFPAFTFDLAAVEYPLEGNRGVPPAEHRFAYDDATFDLVFATSLLTHLRPEALQRYVQEMARVTRPGGRVLVTVFLVRSASPGRAQEGGSVPGIYTGEGWWVASLDEPEKAVGYDEAWLCGVLGAAGLVVASVHHGAWDGAAEPLTYQDVVVAVKPGAPAD